MSNFQKFMKFETSTALETFSKNMTSYVNRDSLSVKCDCYTHSNGQGCQDSQTNNLQIVRPTRFGFRLKMNDHKNGFVIYNPELYHKSGQRLGAGHWRNTTCDCDIHDDATNEKVANMHFCLDDKGAVHNLQLQHEHDNDLHSHEYSTIEEEYDETKDFSSCIGWIMSASGGTNTIKEFQSGIIIKNNEKNTTFCCTKHENNGCTDYTPFIDSSGNTELGGPVCDLGGNGKAASDVECLKHRFDMSICNCLDAGSIKGITFDGKYCHDPTTSQCVFPKNTNGEDCSNISSTCTCRENTIQCRAHATACPQQTIDNNLMLDTSAVIYTNIQDSSDIVLNSSSYIIYKYRAINKCYQECIKDKRGCNAYNIKYGIQYSAHNSIPAICTLIYDSSLSVITSDIFNKTDITSGYNHYRCNELAINSESTTANQTCQ